VRENLNAIEKFGNGEPTDAGQMLAGFSIENNVVVI